MKIPNKSELQEIAFPNSSDIDFSDFKNLYERCTDILFWLLILLIVVKL